MNTADLFRFIALVLQLLAYAILARALLSWFPNTRNNPVVDLLHQITDPIIIPIQRIVPRIGMIDISPLIAMLLLFFLSNLILTAA